MKLSNIKLERPDITYQNSFLNGLKELTTESERFSWIYLGEAISTDEPEKNFGEYVATLLKRETEPPLNFVCDTVYWAISGSEMVGRIAIRHELNEFLKRSGGHIGYIVRPSQRGVGIASEMLAQILKTKRALAIGKLLLTCDEGNLASEKTIIKNGGEYESSIELDPSRPLKKRFWIEARGPGKGEFR